MSQATSLVWAATAQQARHAPWECSLTSILDARHHPHPSLTSSLASSPRSSHSLATSFRLALVRVLLLAVKHYCARPISCSNGRWARPSAAHPFWALNKRGQAQCGKHGACRAWAAHIPGAGLPEQCDRGGRGGERCHLPVPPLPAGLPPAVVQCLRRRIHITCISVQAAQHCVVVVGSHPGRPHVRCASTGNAIGAACIAASASLAYLCSAHCSGWQVLDACLKEIATALLQADVNVRLVANLRNNVKKRVNMEQLASGLNKQKVIEKVGAGDAGPALQAMCSAVQSGEGEQKVGAGAAHSARQPASQGVVACRFCVSQSQLPCQRCAIAAFSAARRHCTASALRVRLEVEHAVGACPGCCTALPQHAPLPLTTISVPTKVNPHRPCLQAVFDELCAMLDGGDPKKTDLKKGKTNVVMFVGLQGKPVLAQPPLRAAPWRRCSRRNQQYAAVQRESSVDSVSALPGGAALQQAGLGGDEAVSPPTACSWHSLTDPAPAPDSTLTPPHPAAQPLPCRRGQDHHLHQVCIPVEAEGLQACHGARPPLVGCSRCVLVVERVDTSVFAAATGMHTAAGQRRPPTSFRSRKEVP